MVLLLGEGLLQDVDVAVLINQVHRAGAAADLSVDRILGQQPGNQHGQIGVDVAKGRFRADGIAAIGGNPDLHRSEAGANGNRFAHLTSGGVHLYRAVLVLHFHRAANGIQVDSAETGLYVDAALDGRSVHSAVLVFHA